MTVEKMIAFLLKLIEDTKNNQINWYRAKSIKSNDEFRAVVKSSEPATVVVYRDAGNSWRYSLRIEFERAVQPAVVYSFLNEPQFDVTISRLYNLLDSITRSENEIKTDNFIETYLFGDNNQ